MPSPTHCCGGGPGGGALQTRRGVPDDAAAQEPAANKKPDAAGTGLCTNRHAHKSRPKMLPLSEPEDPQPASSASRSSDFRSRLPAPPSHPPQRTVAHVGLSLPVTAAGPQRILTVFPGPLSGPNSPTALGIPQLRAAGQVRVVRSGCQPGRLTGEHRPPFCRLAGPGGYMARILSMALLTFSRPAASSWKNSATHGPS